MLTRGIRFEVAQDVLGALIAHWSAQAAEVRDAANPDTSRLAVIQAEQRKLRLLRDELDPDDAAQIESVIAEHAPLARHLPACDGSPAQTHRFTWDKADRLILADTGTTRTELAWNAQGQLIQETQTTADGRRQTLQYAYDPLGHRTRLTLPDGQTLDTLLYGAGHWHQLAWNGTPLIDVERDDLHRETLRTYGGTTFQRPRPTRRQHYTPRGQLAARSWHPDDRPDSPARERQHYHYRADGLLTGIDETGALATPTPQQPQAALHRQIRYAYDAQARLEGWRVDDTGSGRLSGDATGTPAVTHRYTHDHTGDRLAQINGVWLTWDGRGNLTRWETEEGAWTYAWNALNQMTACQHTPAGKSEPAWGVGYHYDAFGRRIARTQLDQRAAQRQRDGTIDPYSVRHRLIRSLWDGDRLLQEILPPWRTLAERQEKDILPSLDQAGALKRTIVYEPGSFEPVAQIVERIGGDESEGSEDNNESAADTQAPRLQFFHTDHLGTPLRLIDSATGDTLWQREQDPWGNTLSETTAPDLDDDAIPTLRLQGQHYDWETGLHYNRFRYYDPKTHRYISQDPIGLLGGIHFYAYVLGNPISNTDPLGLDVYRCKAKLGEPDVAPSWNDASHAYSCVQQDGAMTCKGLVPYDSFGNSHLADEKYDDKLCKKVSDDSCYENCMLAIWKRGPTNWYMTGTCQGYDFRANNFCSNICGK